MDLKYSKYFNSFCYRKYYKVSKEVLLKVILVIATGTACIIINDICSILYQDLVLGRFLLIDTSEYPDKPLPPTPDRVRPERTPSEEECPVKPVKINLEKHPPPNLPPPPEGIKKEQVIYTTKFISGYRCISILILRKEKYMCMHFPHVGFFLTLQKIFKSLLEGGGGGDACTLIKVCWYLKQQGTLILCIKGL